MSLENDITKLQEADVFKPASKQEVSTRQADLLKNLSTPEVKQAIETVLDYLYADELKGWEEDAHDNDGNPDPVEPGHILYSLNILANAIGWNG